MKELNERNVTGSSITINIHSRWGKKKLIFKSTKISKITQTDSLHDRMFELIIHAKAKVWNAITFLCGFLLLFCEVSPLCVVVTSLRFVVSSLCLVMQS